MPQTPCVVDGPADAPLTLVLAHGAGLPMDSPFMQFMAEGIAAQGLRVVRFEFAYMAQRRLDGKKRGPDRTDKLLACYREVVGRYDTERLVIGGKSLGGRMASLLADELGVRGLVCLGYPFHPPDKPEKTRTAHLQTLQTPTLIIQGERDPFGTPEEVAGYALSAAIDIEWIPDGDHGLVPRKRSGYTETGNFNLTLEAVMRFAARLQTDS